MCSQLSESMTILFPFPSSDFFTSDPDTTWQGPMVYSAAFKIHMQHKLNEIAHSLTQWPNQYQASAQLTPVTVACDICQCFI